MIEIDFLALPFASSGNDIKAVRDMLGEQGNRIKILAKIDSVEAVHAFNDILKEADGVIISRNEI